MDARKFPPPPPPRQDFQAQQNEQSGSENTIEEQVANKQENTYSIKEKKPMSKELKMALLLSGATASIIVAIICVVLLFVL